MRVGMEPTVRGSSSLALVLAALVTVNVALLTAPPASAAAAPALTISQSLNFRTTDGTVLHATIAGTGPIAPKPLIVEDSPYAPSASSLNWIGNNYNVIELQWRGTGLSGGSLDTTGPNDQSDLSQFLGWACRQPWSSGSIGLYGFSASAIVAYNAMHLHLPCVKAAALMAGTVDLYRDLLNIGGIPNLLPGAVVEASIGGPTLADGPTRFQTEPGSIAAATEGFVTSPAQVLANPTENQFWAQRTFRGDLDHIPILADTSFYDVEPRGPFYAYNATKMYGSHLLVYGAHDGHPAGLPGPFPQYLNWFDHYLLGQPLSTANQPPVSLYISNGSRQEFLAGNVTHLTGSSWPLPATHWTRLYLAPTRSGSAHSLNDGSLQLAPAPWATQAYPFAPSDFTETDVHTTGVIAPDGLDQLGRAAPFFTDLLAAEPTSLTYTTPPLPHAVTAVGPASLDLSLASATPVTDIYVVVADVWPDGTSYPVATGQLRTSYPNLIKPFSLIDAAGDIVDPYNNLTVPNTARIGTTREYHVEILPIGNTFEPGHCIRVYVVGTPVDQLPSLPGLNTVSLGGVNGSRLIFPTVGSHPEFGG
jgi:putative CocE/NonD family hydrolase